MFNKQDIKQLHADTRSQSLDINILINRIEELERKLGSHMEETKVAFKGVKQDYNQLSKWDDERRDEIFALADAADLEIQRGVHLVAKEDEE